MIKLLLVEDDKSIVSNLTEFLTAEGYEVKSTSGQSEALRLVNAESLKNLKNALLENNITSFTTQDIAESYESDRNLVIIIKGFSYGFETSYQLPWGAISIAVLSVFSVVFATMLYSMQKIKKDNPIDALKNENL